MRTDAPEEMEITHDQCIDHGQDELLVSTGVEDALACLSVESEIAASGYAGPGGEVLLTFDPLMGVETATLTVTAYNRVTSVEEVEVGCGTGVVEEDVQPIDGLAAAYPNPGPGGITIRFEFGRASEAVLEVCTLSGERIRTLVAGDLPAAKHQVRWDGTDASGRPAAAGVYVIRLTSGKMTRTTKAILVR
jgi:hypothetical protein